MERVVLTTILVFQEGCIKKFHPNNSIIQINWILPLDLPLYLWSTCWFFRLLSSLEIEYFSVH